MQADDDVINERIAQRYQVIKRLGRGGVAVVYEVLDTARDRVVALKRPIQRASPDNPLTMLFQREFETLSQLVHPRIIEVYDYQTDELGPYYTMELLSGGDLRQRAPMPWREVCRSLCDVCSALALLHSRRFVHRDLTPLNVRCTADGRAKLFDFGAMVQFGRTKHVVGTPPFIAPEAIHSQAVDGQTDLFSLGATLYFSLVGRHAYPARTLAELPQLWTCAVVPPSRFVPDIPAALDELVLELLQLEPSERPPTAAVVMERLSAIAGIPLDEALLVGQAYLNTPPLIGVEQQRGLVVESLARADAGQGAALLIEGAPGTGRSRFLDSCVLEAKLFGALVLRADANDGTGQPWDVARALVQQLLEDHALLASAALAPHAPVLAVIMPALIEQLRGPTPEATVTSRSEAAGSVNRFQLQAALQAAVLELAKQRLVVLAVDDVDRIDEPSAALLSLLANRARDQRLLVITALRDSASVGRSPAMQLLSNVSGPIRLCDLDSQLTQQLIISLFGDVPNARWLAAQIHEPTHGNPALLMRVAQHFVDDGLCHYAAGTWTVPASLAPEQLGDALQETLPPNLGASALELARMLALLGDRERIGSADALRLCTHADSKRLQADLVALANHDIVSLQDDRISLRRPNLPQLVLRDLSAEQLRALHARLVTYLRDRSGYEFHTVQHLLAAGEVAAAFEQLLTLLLALRPRHSTEPATVFEYMQSLPPHWDETFLTLIDAGPLLGRSRAEMVTVEASYLAYCALTARSGARELALTRHTLQQLSYDAGLDLIEQLRPTVPESELLVRALTAVQERHAALPPQEQGLPLAEAIPLLAQAIIQALSVFARTFDRELLLQLPSLAPIAALSPALAAVQRNVEATVELMTGRFDVARRTYLEIVERLDQPDGAGLAETSRRHMRLTLFWAIGAIEASVGRPRALERADVLATDPLFVVSAARLRTIYALSLGDRRSAEAQRMQIELLKIQHCPPQILEGAQSFQWTIGYAGIGDLSRVKQCLTQVELLAHEHAGWRPVLHYARGTYQSLRGDHVRALLEYDQVLAMTGPGEHVVWPYTASGKLWSLLRLERPEEVIAVARENLEAIDRAGLHASAFVVLVPLSLAEDALGQTESALAHVDQAIELLSLDDGGGVQLGGAYEARARIALRMGDEAAFVRAADACERQYRLGGQRTLLARHKKLITAARKTGLIAPDPLAPSENAGFPSLEEMRATVASALGVASDIEHKAQQALSLLGRFTDCDAGFLYLRTPSGPALLAQLGAAEPMPDMDACAARLMLEDGTEVTQDAVETTNHLWIGQDGSRYLPMLLWHHAERAGLVVGVAIMCFKPDVAQRMPTVLLDALSHALYDAVDAPQRSDPTRLARHRRPHTASRDAGLVTRDRRPNEELGLASVEGMRMTVAAALGAARDPAHRAQQALSLLGRSTESEAGFLYLRAASGPELVAQFGAAEPMPEMDACAARLMRDDNAEITQEDASVTTQLWTRADGTGYRPMLLCDPDRQTAKVVAVAIMCFKQDVAPRAPTALLEALGRALHEAGDSVYPVDASG
jgi:hypothetical protein